MSIIISEYDRVPGGHVVLSLEFFVRQQVLEAEAQAERNRQAERTKKAKEHGPHPLWTEEDRDIFFQSVGVVSINDLNFLIVVLTVFMMHSFGYSYFSCNHCGTIFFHFEVLRIVCTVDRC